MQRYSKSPFKRGVHAGLRIENKASDEATVYIYDEISWWGVLAEDVVKEIDGITASTIRLRLNTPGGSVTDGIAIYNAAKRHNAKVIVHIDGLAASMGSVIAMAGDEIVMGEGSFMMIHDPWSIMIGTAEDFRAEADLLDKVGGSIAQIYKGKSGKEIDEINQLMSDETWMTAEEAVEMGFADRIDKKKEEDKKNQAKVLFDLSVFANVPDQLKENKGTPTAREMEQALRDVGCSAKMAKTILAKGFVEDDLRDEDPSMILPQRDVADSASNDPVHDLLIRAALLAPRATL